MRASPGLVPTTAAVAGTGHLGTETHSESRAQRPHAHLGDSVQGILISGSCHQKEEEAALMHDPAHEVHDTRHPVGGEGARVGVRVNVALILSPECRFAWGSLCRERSGLGVTGMWAPWEEVLTVAQSTQACPWGPVRAGPLPPAQETAEDLSRNRHC